MEKTTLCSFICLILCCELAKADPKYPSTFEDRLNSLENELENTKVKLVKTEHRLGESELKNKQLETKLQRHIETFDSKYKELYDTIENTQTTLKVAIEELKSTDAELRVTQEELKISPRTLHTTIAKSYGSNVESMDSEFHAVGSKHKHSKFKIVKDVFKNSHIYHNGTRSNPGQLIASEESLGQRLATVKKTTNRRVSRFGMHIRSTQTTPLVIAFHAELGHHTNNLTSNTTIRFETVTQNFGNAYDSLLGYFNCPISGFYFFTFTIMAKREKEIETKLVVNGSPIAYSYSAGPPGPPALFNAGSKSVVKYLNPGDKVWIEFHNYKDNCVHGGPWSTFTGFMIK